MMMSDELVNWNLKTRNHRAIQSSFFNRIINQYCAGQPPRSHWGDITTIIGRSRKRYRNLTPKFQEPNYTFGYQNQLESYST